MRLSIFAMPAQHGASAQNAAPDGRKLRSRLGLEDSGFDVADMDPGRDLAEQMETLLASRGITARDEVMFYAGCQALLSVEGELFCASIRARRRWGTRSRTWRLSCATSSPGRSSSCSISWT